MPTKQGIKQTNVNKIQQVQFVQCCYRKKQTTKDIISRNFSEPEVLKAVNKIQSNTKGHLFMQFI